MKQPGRFLMAMAVLISVCWLVPVYLIGISALGPRDAATAWPKSLLPANLSLDTLNFFFQFTGVWQAVLNSAIVAALTMLMSIGLGVFNLTNSQGLAEGSPRVGATQVTGGQFFVARPILPRRVSLTATYSY